VRSLSWPVSGSPPPSPTSSPSSTKPITTSTPTPTGGHCSGVAAWSSGVAYTGGQEATYGKPRFINSVMHSSYFAPLRRPSLDCKVVDGGVLLAVSKTLGARVLISHVGRHSWRCRRRLDRQRLLLNHFVSLAVLRFPVGVRPAMMMLICVCSV
jgi:hypothetical protein